MSESKWPTAPSSPFAPGVNQRIIDIWAQAEPGELMGIDIGEDEAVVTVGDRIARVVRLDGGDDLLPCGHPKQWVARMPDGIVETCLACANRATRDLMAEIRAEIDEARASLSDLGIYRNDAPTIPEMVKAAYEAGAKAWTGE